jgi:hypothetical protein
MSEIFYHITKAEDYVGKVTINGSDCVPVFRNCGYEPKDLIIDSWYEPYLKYIYQLSAQRALALPDVPMQRYASELLNISLTAVKFFEDPEGTEKLKVMILQALVMVQICDKYFGSPKFESISLSKVEENDEPILKVVIDGRTCFEENVDPEHLHAIRDFMSTFGYTCPLDEDNYKYVMEALNAINDKDKKE